METELVVVWNGTMGREYRPFIEPIPFVNDPIEPLPPKDPHDSCWREERNAVLALMADGQARRIAAIGKELNIAQRQLHGFVQQWKRKGVMKSSKAGYGFIRLVKGSRP